MRLQSSSANNGLLITTISVVFLYKVRYQTSENRILHEASTVVQVMHMLPLGESTPNISIAETETFGFYRIELPTVGHFERYLQVFFQAKKVVYVSTVVTIVIPGKAHLNTNK